MLFGRKKTTADLKIHVGSGPNVMPGWINLDNQPYEGVDRVLDIRDGLPFKGARLIFAEHFIEHLTWDEGAAFLRECRGALRDDGILRLSTPNLDWVWSTQYHFRSWQQPAEAVRDCFWMNKAFRGWGHQFLYNLETLTQALRKAGFGEVVFHEYGESDHPELRGIERHPRDIDEPGMRHVIIVEASGFSTEKSTMLDGPLADYNQAINAK